MFGLPKKWNRLRSGLYVPPLLRRLHRDERGLWYPCCVGEVCTACKDGNHPSELRLTVAGIQNTEGCITCTGANDNWAAPLYSPCYVLGDTHTTTYFGNSQVQPCCPGDWFQAFVNITWKPGTGTRRIFARARCLYDDALDVKFVKEESGQSEPFDCANFANLDIPFDVDDSTKCDGSGATCKLSLPLKARRHYSVPPMPLSPELETVIGCHTPDCKGRKVSRQVFRERAEHCNKCEHREGLVCMLALADRCELATLLAYKGHVSPGGKWPPVSD